MRLQCTFELTLSVDSDKFSKLLNRVYKETEHLDDDEHIDHSLVSNGITVVYRDSQYKKKVRLIVNTNWILDTNEPDDIPKLIGKLEKRVSEYFNSKYRLNDFNLSGMVLAADMDVGDRAKVSAYLKVLQRVGKVKGFSPSGDYRFDDDVSFWLKGNSNAIEFWLYDLEGLLREQMEESDSKHKRLKPMAKKAAGIIRVEVRLTKPKAIREYTDETGTVKQMAQLLKRDEKIFLDTFLRIVPFGNFHKKERAVEIIKRAITDNKMKRRMLRLLELVPEKKSLLLAQKALDCRKLDDVMDSFEAIDLSPVTISKRHDVKHLKNLYSYL